MRKFFGAIGYGDSVETSPGVWEDTIVEEREYFGDVIRNTRRLTTDSDKVNFDIALSNSIRVVADEFLNEHIHAIRYVRWAGALWIATSVEVQRPRLILELGGVYNGPTYGSP